MYYIRTCTDISICPLHLGSTRPWACRALHATKVSDYKQLSLQLHFAVSLSLSLSLSTMAIMIQWIVDSRSQKTRKYQQSPKNSCLVGSDVDPFPVIVTTRIITCLVGNSNLFLHLPLLLGRVVQPKILIPISGLLLLDISLVPWSQLQGV